MQGWLIGLSTMLSTTGYYSADVVFRGLGFTGIAIALLGRNNPIGIAFAAFLWAFMDILQTPLARAKLVELHGRLAEGTPSDRPVIETVLKISQGSVQELHAMMAVPFDADVRMLLSGLKDFAPKPWPERFREIAAAGGRVEITQSRIQQGEVIAVAAGSLGLNAGGRLDGELQMTLAGIEKVIAALGIEKMLEEGVPQATLDRVAPGVKSQDVSNLLGALDRMVPGLGKVVKQNANAGVTAGINALGKDAVLEGRKARAFPLRFVDGAVFFGPLRVGQVPPLF